jgi:hypothetical protein
MKIKALSLAVVALAGCATYRYNGPQLASIDSACKAAYPISGVPDCIERAFERHDKEWRSDPDHPYVYSYISNLRMLAKQVSDGGLSQESAYNLSAQYMQSLAQQKYQNDQLAAANKTNDLLTISSMASIISAGASIYSVATPAPRRQQICNWHKVGTMWQQVCN